MHPESVDEPNGEELTVPMNWIRAEYLADRMMSEADLTQFGSVEYRSGRDVLTLTLFLAHPRTDLVDLCDEDQRDSWLYLTADPPSWRHWVDDRLLRNAARIVSSGEGAAETAMALATWSRLCTTELLPPHQAMPSRLPGAPETVGPSWVPAWDLGVTLAHIAVQNF
ncbi:hypothetical protein [Streptomyces sp. NPDC058548]|uniref:hypothetical protein n=1 Tax=unclassified Streptomyces TaxID=2593676 RepID=UPI00366832DC